MLAGVGLCSATVMLCSMSSDALSPERTSSHKLQNTHRDQQAPTVLKANAGRLACGGEVFKQSNNQAIAHSHLATDA